MPAPGAPHLERFGAAWARDEARWVELLRRLVDVNTHSDNIAGVDASRGLLVPELRALGFTVEEPLVTGGEVPRPRAAHLVARRPAPGRPRVLLIAHLDTVFPPGDAFSSFTRAGQVLAGPGVGDIKGGVVSILAALTGLEAAALSGCVDVTVFANSDEEVGSHAARRLLREIASGSDCALGFEPAFHAPGESVLAHSRIQHVTRRKGCGRYAFRLTGTAAHSGGAHHLGASAIEALARKISAVHSLTDRASGVTTNVGLVSGGRSVNTVAPFASGEIDFRFETADAGEDTARRMREMLERSEDVNAGVSPVTCQLEPGGGALWPPLVPTPRSLALSDLLVRVTAECGYAAEAISRGGASDAAHAAAVGTPAICGLGPVTSGIHTDHEQTSVGALRQSAIIAASLFVALGQGVPQPGR